LGNALPGHLLDEQRITEKYVEIMLTDENLYTETCYGLEFSMKFRTFHLPGYSAEKAGIEDEEDVVELCKDVRKELYGKRYARNG
jgi:hypothetical protein